MPTKKNSNGKNPETYKKPTNKQAKSEKRKSSSPLYDTKLSGQYASVVNASTSGLSGTPGYQNKRVNNSISPQYFMFPTQQNMQSNMQNAQGGNVNFQNQNMANFANPQYSWQYMQSPTYKGSVMQPMPLNSPPEWALQIIEDSKQIKLDVKTIDDIEKTVNKVLMNDQSLEEKYKTAD